jgi:hypothetical protein
VKREGKGVYKEKDGSMYEGDWVSDLPDGQGTKTYPDGTKYTVFILTHTHNHTLSEQQQKQQIAPNTQS